MRSKESFLLFFLLLSISSYEGVLGNKGYFDNDTSEDCGEIARAGKCVQDAETFSKCGLSCSKFYDPGNVGVDSYETLGFEQDEKSYKLQGDVTNTAELDDFYELEIKLAKNGKTMSFDDFDGMVTVIAVVPLIPGMAQYYYDMFHRVRNVFPFTIELVLLPVRTSGYNEVPTLPPKSKVHLSVDVTEEDRGDVMNFIDKCFKPGERKIDFDRVTFYIMGISGYTERKISPTIEAIERLIKHYVDEMSFKTREL